jgi:hypothetical protein
MSQTLLQLVQSAGQEMALVGSGQPSSVIGNSQADIVQLLALANACGNEIARQKEWQAMQVEYRFTTQFLTTTGTWGTTNGIVTGIPTTAALSASLWQATGVGINQDTYIQSVDSGTQVTLTQTPTAAGAGAGITFSQTKYALPGGFDRLIDRTDWDKSKHWEMLGPITQQQLEWLKSGYISTGPRIRYYVMGNYFQIWPPLNTNEYLGYNYVSSYWAASSSGASQGSFLADTDTCIFPDRLMTLALKLKYFEAKGFDTTAYYRDYQMQLDIAKANDSGSPILSYAPRISNILIGWENIPDSNYGS